jgi:hypothetical protein
MAIDQKVQVELLWQLLPWPLGADMVRCQLEGDLLAVRCLDGDPVDLAADDGPPCEFGIERGELPDVAGIEGCEF